MKKIEIVRHTPEKCLKNEILSYTRNRNPQLGVAIRETGVSEELTPVSLFLTIVLSHLCKVRSIVIVLLYPSSVFILSEVIILSINNLAMSGIGCFFLPL